MTISKSNLTFALFLIIIFFSDIFYYFGLSNVTAILIVLLIFLLVNLFKVHEFLIIITLFLVMAVMLYAGTLLEIHEPSYFYFAYINYDGYIFNKIKGGNFRLSFNNSFLSSM